MARRWVFTRCLEQGARFKAGLMLCAVHARLVRPRAGWHASLQCTCCQQTL